MAANSRKNRKARYLVILALSSLLIVYHLAKAFSVFWGDASEDISALIYVQVGVRLAIVLSLVFVLLGFRNSLWGMWLFISALTVTRYMLLGETEAATEVEFTVYLSYLRGFIAPTIITLLYPASIKHE